MISSSTNPDRTYKFYTGKTVYEFGTVNQTKEVFFPLTVRHLLAIAGDGTKWLHPGSYDVLIGQQHIHTIKLYGQSIQWGSKRHGFPSNESI
ncbi:unnamed protein product [Rotaria sp. Silwood2]|nr:unnamed protein product [Rotaria sp. Silwood2]